MNTATRRQVFRQALYCSATAALSLGLLSRAGAQTAPSKVKAVFQVSDADPMKWNLTMNNVNNALKDLGESGAELEVVVYGPGIGMLKADSPVGERIAQARKLGVKVVACENTMHGMQLTPAQMLPTIGYVPSGVVELMKKQGEGYAYIRP
jgi:intracellular sulfur oxidation DsrE/DsrF family protein